MTAVLASFPIHFAFEEEDLVRAGGPLIQPGSKTTALTSACDFAHSDIAAAALEEENLKPVIGKWFCFDLRKVRNLCFAMVRRHSVFWKCHQCAADYGAYTRLDASRIAIRL